MKTVCRVFAYLKRYPWIAAATLTCAILSTAMVIIFPTVTKWIINDVMRGDQSREIAPVDFVGSAGVSGSARFRRAADCAEQHVRAKSDLRSAGAICILTFNYCRSAGSTIALRAI